MTNDICRLCTGGINTINGRHCRILDIRVEYARTPPCDTTPQSLTV